MSKAVPILLLIVCVLSCSGAFSQQPNPKPPAPEKQASEKPADKSKEKASEKRSESLAELVLRLTGISATSRGLKGELLPSIIGDLWVVDRLSGIRERITTSGDCRSPIFAADDRTVLALRGSTIFVTHLDTVQSEDLIKAPTGTEKLVGVDQTAPGDDLRILIITANGLGLLSVRSNKFNLFSSDHPADLETLETLKRSDVKYDDFHLFVDRPDRPSARPGSAVQQRGTEVYLDINQEQEKQLTACSPDICGQAALSHDHQHVVFVRGKK